MTRIPVGATIAHAYRFAFGSFVRILAVVWTTWLAMVVLSIVMMRTTMAFSIAIAARDFHALGGALILLIPFYLLVLLLMFMQISGIARLALGLLPTPLYFYFSLDRGVWRLIGKSLLAIVIMIVAYVALVIAGIFMAAAARLLGGGTGVLTALAAAIVLIIGILAYFYGVMRLTFFLTPVVLAEERSGLKRAWALGRSNFWRAFAVLLAIFLPVMVLEFAWLFGPWGPGLPPAPPMPATPALLAAHNAAMAQWNEQLMGTIYGAWYITIPVFLLVTILFYGAMVGAQCFAYRALTAEEPV